jgi:hypothetical protein
MNPDTAELTVAPDAAEPAVPFQARARALEPGGRHAGRVRHLRADPERMTALRDTWRALWISRALVWATGVATILTLGYGPVRKAFNPPGVTSGFGSLGDLLAAPAARWDSAWYLVIAHYGYRPDLGGFTASRAAFFPLYPLGLHTIALLGVPAVLAGVLLSLAALAVALYCLHRLTTLELSRPEIGLDRDRVAHAASLVVLLTAFAPMAFYLSAVYSESLYLALSVGLFLSARRGNWALVGILGALASATRSTGLVLLVPAAIIYLYGPREDRAPDFARARSARWAALRPRYRVRRDVLWLAVLPAGAVLYGVYLGLSGGDFLTPLHTQGLWGRHFAGPFVGVWDGIKAAFEGARQLLSFQRHHLYFPAGGSPFVSAGHNLMLLGFLLAAIPGVIGVARRLPGAYVAYLIAALAIPLSYPVSSQPLMSLPRFLLVLFPLAIWLALWLSEHPRLQRPAIFGSALAMMFFLAQFATWHWVA